MKGSQSFFRKSLEKLHSSHKCPLCMRGFEEQDSLDNTIRLVGVVEWEEWVGLDSFSGLVDGEGLKSRDSLDDTIRMVGGAG